MTPGWLYRVPPMCWERRDYMVREFLLDAGSHGLDAGYPVGVVGLYRLLHHGRLPRSVFYGGLFLLLFGCLFLTAGYVPGNEWVARHQILGAGGWRAICWELVCFFRWPGDPLCWRFPGWAICWPWFMQPGCVPVRFAGPCCGNGVPGV